MDGIALLSFDRIIGTVLVYYYIKRDVVEWLSDNASLVVEVPNLYPG